MDTRTREALEASIRHWEKNFAAEIPDNASVNADDCALCDVFNSVVSRQPDCEGCPVFALTGKELCTGTPFENAFFAWREWRDHKTGKLKFQKAAQAELDFLRSLLPSEEGDTNV